MQDIRHRPLAPAWGVAVLLALTIGGALWGTWAVREGGLAAGFVQSVESHRLSGHQEVTIRGPARSCRLHLSEPIPSEDAFAWVVARGDPAPASQGCELRSARVRTVGLQLPVEAAGRALRALEIESFHKLRELPTSTAGALGGLLVILAAAPLLRLLVAAFVAAAAGAGAYHLVAHASLASGPLVPVSWLEPASFATAVLGGVAAHAVLPAVAPALHRMLSVGVLLQFAPVAAESLGWSPLATSGVALLAGLIGRAPAALLQGLFGVALLMA